MITWWMKLGGSRPPGDHSVCYLLQLSIYYYGQWEPVWSAQNPRLALDSVLSFLQGMSILCVYNYSEVTYNRTYHYPKWAIGCGWLMSFSSVSFIPLVMVWKMAWAKGSFIEVRSVWQVFEARSNPEIRPSKVLQVRSLRQGPWGKVLRLMPLRKGKVLEPRPLR